MNTRKNAKIRTRPYARTSCAHFVEMAKDFGFKCTDKLAALDVDAKLSDICCASCKKPKATTPKTTTSKSKKTCGAPSYVGDGNCDDNNNNKGCGYDGGDCCAKSVQGGKVQDTHCQKVSLWGQSGRVT